MGRLDERTDERIGIMRLSLIICLPAFMSLHLAAHLWHICVFQLCASAAFLWSIYSNK